MDTFVCSRCGLAPERTQHGRLPPWEIAKAVAFATVLADIAEHFGQSASELIGDRVDEYIAKQLTLVGGGRPSARAVRDLVSKNKTGDFYCISCVTCGQVASGRRHGSAGSKHGSSDSRGGKGKGGKKKRKST